MRNVNKGPKTAKKRVRFRKGDKVVVIAGEDKGKGPAEVLRVLPDTGRIVVQGVNLQTQHLRKSQDNPQGGITKKEGPIDASNVLLYSDKLKKGVRVRFETRDGKKVRVGVTCGTVFD